MKVKWHSIIGLVKIARMSKVPKEAVFQRMKTLTGIRIHETPEDAETILRRIVDEVYEIPEQELESLKEWLLREADQLDPEGTDELADRILSQLGQRQAN